MVLKPKRKRKKRKKNNHLEYTLYATSTTNELLGQRDKKVTKRQRSVEETLASDRAAQTGDTIRSIHLAFEFVVVREFFVCVFVSFLIVPEWRRMIRGWMGRWMVIGTYPGRYPATRR